MALSVVFYDVFCEMLNLLAGIFLLVSSVPIPVRTLDDVDVVFLVWFE